MKAIRIGSCPKAYSADLDKAVAPAQTIAAVSARLKAFGSEILAGVKRIDTGRLGIPVYLGLCGPAARAIMPTRKQMGKGSSVEQAQASAMMELMERYAFFSFWERLPNTIEATWGEAEARFGENLIPIGEILRSVNDSLPETTARQLLNLRSWLFFPATDLATGQIIWLPIDWFRLLGEFNGSSAGNTTEESLLQGLSELVERHVCCFVDNERPILPTIDQTTIEDKVLASLCEAFAQNGVRLELKNLSMDMPLPTIGAIAWDPATFPHNSEIVFTAGAATSPAKAAIRAITEVAQLGGDFCTHSCYEASGLPKFSTLAECQWLLQGPEIALASIPSASANDIGLELQTAIAKLAPLRVFAVETTNPELNIPAHWLIVPGLQFRERDKNQSLGLFLSRLLAEQAEPELARRGLAKIAQAYPNASFLAFFEGMLSLRQGEFASAAENFETAASKHQDAESKGLAKFYAGYALSQNACWQAAMAPLEAALQLAPDLKEAANLLGVCCFKQQNYARAEEYFDQALTIDKGSAMDLANRGLARKFQGKNQEALRDLQDALELDPSLEFAQKHLQELLDN